MPPMFSGELTLTIYEEFSSPFDLGVAQTTPVYRPQSPPKAQTAYDPFVRPNPLEFAAAQGQVVVKEVNSDSSIFNT